MDIVNPVYDMIGELFRRVKCIVIRAGCKIYTGRIIISPCWVYACQSRKFDEMVGVSFPSYVGDQLGNLV